MPREYTIKKDRVESRSEIARRNKNKSPWNRGFDLSLIEKSKEKELKKIKRNKIDGVKD